MEKENPIFRHAPSEFYSGEALQAAEAIRNRDYSTLAAILNKSPSVAANRGKKEVPLVGWAMSHDDPKSVKLLLDAGAPANDYIFDKDDKMSLVGLATGAKRPDHLELLLSHGGNPNGLPGTEPPLFIAMILKDPLRDERFERLLKASADPNQQDDVGVPIIFHCADLNDYQKALELVKLGADPNLMDRRGSSLRKIIEQFPLVSSTPQGRAQAELARMLK
jgi:ankyrin repeat protein